MPPNGRRQDIFFNLLENWRRLWVHCDKNGTPSFFLIEDGFNVTISNYLFNLPKNCADNVAAKEYRCAEAKSEFDVEAVQM